MCIYTYLGCNEHVCPSGPRFYDPRFSEEFPPAPVAPLSDYPAGEYEDPGFGGYSGMHDYPEPEMDRRPFPDGMGHHPARGGDGYGPGHARDVYERSGPMEEHPGRRVYPDEYSDNRVRSSLMDRPRDKALDRPGLMGAAPDSGNAPNTLLTYLVCVLLLTIVSSSLYSNCI